MGDIVKLSDRKAVGRSPQDQAPEAPLPGGLRGDAGSNPARSAPKAKGLNGLEFIAIRIPKRKDRRDTKKMQALLGLMDIMKTMAKEEIDLELGVDIIIKPKTAPKSSIVSTHGLVSSSGKPLIQ